MSSTKRSPARQGIESRKDAKGREQHRGYVTVDKATGRKRRGPWTSSLAEARSWRVDALAALQAGTMSNHRGPTVREAVSEFEAGIASGTIHNRSGRPYKPSVVRDYRRDLTQRIVPAVGATRLGELTVQDVQRLVGSLSARGLAPSSVRNTYMALRALYAWAIPHGYARQNPCERVRVPSGGRKRERIAAPDEAALLVAAVPSADRPAIALACYAGLRAGELLALDWEHVDLDLRMVRVERAWDHGSGAFIEPKSTAAYRDVPITERLYAILLDHHEATGGVGLLFPARGHADRPVSHSGLVKRMQAAWTAVGLEALGLHEARHTFASMLIAAGANAKAITTYMGHGSIAITFDRYGHLMPGHEAEVRGLLDAYLSGAA